jgi:hypothetical protein
MGYRTSQVNMTQALTTHLARDNFNTTLFANNAAVLHALVLAAVALVVLGWDKDFSTEKTITFRLESPVIDRFRLLNLAKRPLSNLFRRRDRETYSVKVQWVFRSLKKAINIFQDASSFSGWGFATLSVLFQQLDVETERLKFFN